MRKKVHFMHVEYRQLVRSTSNWQRTCTLTLRTVWRRKGSGPGSPFIWSKHRGRTPDKRLQETMDVQTATALFALIHPECFVHPSRPVSVDRRKINLFHNFSPSSGPPAVYVGAVIIARAVATLMLSLVAHCRLVYAIHVLSTRAEMVFIGQLWTKCELRANNTTTSLVWNTFSCVDGG